MGSENRQKSFRCNLKSVVTLLFPPRFDRAAFKTRRYLPERLNFPQAPRQHERRREAASARRVLRAARSNLGGTDRIKADFRNLGEHLWQFSLPIELFLPHGSSVCRHRAPCKPSSVIGTSVSL